MRVKSSARHGGGGQDAMEFETTTAPVSMQLISRPISQLKKLRPGEEALYIVDAVGLLQNFDLCLFLF